MVTRSFMSSIEMGRLKWYGGKPPMAVVDAKGMNGGDLGGGSRTRRRTAARVIARARPEARWISRPDLGPVAPESRQSS
ncbi:hypothetical protein ACFX13_043938 [Malus domestica]